MGDRRVDFSNNQKSCIVYIRYFDSYQPKTSYYGSLDMEGDGTAANRVETISDVWQKDDLNPVNSCWFESDNEPAFPGTFKSSKKGF